MTPGLTRTGQPTLIPRRMHPLELIDVRRSYGAGRGLAGVGLTVAAGEVYGLLGPNGAGKTTLVRAVTGRLRLDGGTVRLSGRDPADSLARRRLGLVPQDIALYPDLSVRENLFCLGQLAGLTAEAARGAVPKALAWTDLADRADSLVGTLSGGQQRRVNLAAGTLHQPDLLVLDEPTVGVDPPAREAIHRMLLELKARGTAILLATHDLEQAAELADRVGVLVRGRLAAEGTVPGLLAQWFPPGSKDLALTLGKAPSPGATSLLEAAGLLPDPARVQWTGPFGGGVERLPSLLAGLAEAGAPAVDARIREPGLRGVFFRVAGEEMTG